MPEIESQWTSRGFMDRYDQLLKSNDHKTYYDTYLATEQEHITIFGYPRYSNYESFRSVRKKYVQK
jgi:hypothetical protein